MSEIYSHSRLSNFENCPLKFKYRYILKIKTDVEGIEGFMGKRAHEVLERLYLAVGRGNVPSHEQVMHRYRELWDEHFDEDNVRIVRSENSPLYYKELGERCLSDFYRRTYPFDADQTLAIEKHVSFSLDDDGAYRMQGFIDRIARARDGAIEIQDYKTSARVPSQKALDQDRQLALYQMAVGRTYGEDRPVRLVWHYLQRNQTRTSTRTPEQLDELRHATIGLIDRIRAEDAFEPKPGPLCRWCEYSDRCPVGPESAKPKRQAPEDTPPPTRAAKAADNAPSKSPGTKSGKKNPAPKPASANSRQLNLL